MIQHKLWEIICNKNRVRCVQIFTWRRNEKRIHNRNIFEMGIWCMSNPQYHSLAPRSFNLCLWLVWVGFMWGQGAHFLYYSRRIRGIFMVHRSRVNMFPKHARRRGDVEAEHRHAWEHLSLAITVPYPNRFHSAMHKEENIVINMLFKIINFISVEKNHHKPSYHYLAFKCLFFSRFFFSRCDGRTGWSRRSPLIRAWLTWCEVHYRRYSFEEGARF